jgi:glycosyltransferase involved in cell wall biosynthesis
MIFVNDGSTDSSPEILDRLAESGQRIRVIHFRSNFGQTAAKLAGFDYSRGDVIIPMDGDGQNDPADIEGMLKLLESGYDVVSGWRKDRQDEVIQRNVPSILANRLISAVSGVRLHDFGCSLKAYKRQVVEGSGCTERCAGFCQFTSPGTARRLRNWLLAIIRAPLAFDVRTGASGQSASRLLGREVP